jgi:hypothetical protein
LQGKLRGRSPALARALRHVQRPDPHPLFRLVSGGVRPWEIRTASPLIAAHSPALAAERHR